MRARLSILLIHGDPDRARALAAGLGGLGDHDLRQATGAEAAGAEADVVIIDAAGADDAALDRTIRAARPMDRPVVVFVDRADPARTRILVAAGVAALVIDGLRAARVAAVVQVAMARFDADRALRADLAAAQGALSDRRVIDRAKATLMAARGIDEQAAYALLRKTAMDRGLRIAVLSRQIVDAAALLR